MKTRCRPNRT